MTAAWPFGGLRRNHYRTLAIDPPWKFSAGTKGRPQHYPRMTDAEIAALPIADLCHPEGCNIFLWITSPIDGRRFWRNIDPIWQRQGIRHSGRAFVWIKTHRVLGNGGDPLFIHKNSINKGQGLTTRKNAEDVLLFKTGKPARVSKSVDEVIIAPLRQHSRKPDEFYARAAAYGEGPRAEIFARESRPGWDTFGNETTKFDLPHEAAA